MIVSSRSASLSLQTTKFTHHIKDDENQLRRKLFMLRKQQEPVVWSDPSLRQDYQIMTFIKKSHSSSLHQKAPKSANIETRHRKDPAEFKIQKCIFLLRDRLQRNMQEQCQVDKERQMIQSTVELKKDLAFLGQISKNGLQQFKSRLGLYQKYYSQELMDPENLQCRMEDLNIGLNGAKERKINPTSFRQILHCPQPKEKFCYEDIRNSFKDLVIDPQRLSKIKNKYQQTLENFEKVSYGTEEREFLNKVKKGDLQEVRFEYMLNNNLINARDYMMETPLHWAVKRNHFELTDFLLHCKADVTAQDLAGRTPKNIAQFLKHYKIIKVQKNHLQQLLNDHDHQILNS